MAEAEPISFTTPAWLGDAVTRRCTGGGAGSARSAVVMRDLQRYYFMVGQAAADAREELDAFGWGLLGEAVRSVPADMSLPALVRSLPAIVARCSAGGSQLERARVAEVVSSWDVYRRMGAIDAAGRST